MDQKRRAGAVARHNSGAFLAAVLKREQAVVSQDRRVRMTEHAEKTALVLRKRLALVRFGVVDLVQGHTK